MLHFPEEKTELGEVNDPPRSQSLSAQAWPNPKPTLMPPEWPMPGIHFSFQLMGNFPAEVCRASCGLGLWHCPSRCPLPTAHPLVLTPASLAVCGLQGAHHIRLLCMCCGRRENE